MASCGYSAGMPPQHKPGKPLDPAVMARAAELVGMGLSQREAAGAVGVNVTTVERLLKKPEYRKIADDEEKRRVSLTAQAANVVQALLMATNHDGTPDMVARRMGADLFQKNPDLYSDIEVEEGEASLLPGVVLRFPYKDEATRPAQEKEGQGAEPVESLSIPRPGGAAKGASHSEPNSENVAQADKIDKGASIPALRPADQPGDLFTDADYA